MPTLGLVCNIYNDVHALHGWLETHTSFFDHTAAYHTGPNAEYSNDGTIELLEKWNVPIKFGSINDGFGVVRTEAIRMSPCDYVMILDADERFYPLIRHMRCVGEPTTHSEVDEILRTYDFRDLSKEQPDWECIKRLGANLRVELGEVFNQGAFLRDLISSNQYDAISSVRRHWHDFTFTKPTQNWHSTPDWQLRIVKNKPEIKFASNTRMHEQLQGHTITFPAYEHGPYFDHFHFSFKKLNPTQRSHNVAVYDSIHQGIVPPTLEEFTRNK